MSIRNVLLLIAIFAFGIKINTAENNGMAKSINNQIMEIVCSIPLMGLSHDHLVCLGLICKNNDKALRITAESRKQYLLSLAPTSIPNIAFFTWHGYGSRADCKKIVRCEYTEPIPKNKLILGRLELSDNGTIHNWHGNWDNFESELWHRPIPFYNENQQLCLIGIGWINNNWGWCGNVLCYRSSCEVHKDKIEEDILRCVLQAHSKGLTKYPLLIPMTNFPYLLKSILNSKQVRKEIINKNSFGGNFLVFNLAGVTLPDNYKEDISHQKSCSRSYSFTELDPDLQQALAEKYNQQKTIV